MSNMTPFLSIIIPSFNQGLYLPEAIESALNQTIPCEIMVIDDGSTDNSLEIARKYPIKVISQVNKGLSSARNTGIMNATGLYVLPLDADDILLPNCAESVLEKAKETNADVIGLSFKCFGKAQDTIILMQNPTIEDFKVGNRLGYCSAIKKEVLLECGGYSSKMVWGAEDYHLWHDLLNRGKKIVTITEILWLYRTKENSMWTETIKHKDQYMAQIKKDFPNL